MLDIGWTEILVITVIALFVVGPKDIPKALRTVGVWLGKLKSLSREFQNTVEDAVRDSELDEVKKQIQSAKSDFTKGMTDTIDSEGELTEMMRGVDLIDKEKNDKPSSSWPIPLNKKDEIVDSIKDEKEIVNKDDLEIDKEKEKPTPTT